MTSAIPKMRFPEFKDEWHNLTFSDFLEPVVRPVTKPEGRYLSVGVRSHGKGTFQRPESDPSKIAMERLYVVRENDLIVNITFAWEGAIAIVPARDDGGFTA